MKAIFSTFVIMCLASTSALANPPPAQAAGKRPSACSPHVEGVYRSVTTVHQSSVTMAPDQETPPVAVGSLTIADDGTVSGSLFRPDGKQIFDDSFTGKISLSDSPRCLWAVTVLFTDGTRNDLALVGSTKIGFSGTNLVTTPSGEQFTAFTRLDAFPTKE